MGQLRDRMETDLKLGGYSPSTQNIYLLYARRFAEHFMRSPAQMGEEQIRQYLLHVVQDKKRSRETYKQIRAALIFLYTVTLKRPTEVDHLPVRRNKVKLPVVLSGTEVDKLLAAIRSRGFTKRHRCRERPAVSKEARFQYSGAYGIEKAREEADQVPEVRVV